ncbi:major facilitator superfamily domain-containing protein [Diplogelasinospora grovesii]|uniref:Major facilitator superfamily domain-containing protein n=1 Tax=Diplogelasinospora grovesii TaxID=303347 RepID=A0AAN6N5P2_9PEZI|nr:major facilitator superfamily domain-containing protein [Diplogelasinospora grovesii]
MRVRNSHNDRNNMGQYQPTEATSLLREQLNRSGSSGRIRHIQLPKLRTATGSPKERNATITLALVYLAATLGSSSLGVFSIPATRILEDILCRQHYSGAGDSSDVPIDERLCKVDAIQSRLAFIFAYYFTVRSVVSVLATLPWSIVADRFGRRPVLIAAPIGLLLDQTLFAVACRFSTVIPLQVAWLSPTLNIVGGGVPTLLATLLSMVADIVPETSRGVAFVGLHVAGMTGIALTPSLSAFMADRLGPWPVLLFAISLAAMATIIFVAIPESLPNEKRRKGQLDDALDAEAEHDGIKGLARNVLYRLKESFTLLRSTPLLLLLGTSLAVQPINSSVGQFLNQFVSKRYGVSLAQTGYVQSAYGISHLFVAIVLIPMLSSWLLGRTNTSGIHVEVGSPRSPAPLLAPETPIVEAPPVLDVDGPDRESASSSNTAAAHRRDMLLARASFAVLVVGAVLIALAPSLSACLAGLLVLSLGAGFNSLTRSLVAVFVDVRHRTRVFGLLGIAEEFGTIYAHPFLAVSLSFGMRLDSESRGWFPWIGLPYLGIAILTALATGLLFFVRVPQGRAVVSEQAEEGETW